MLYRGRCHRGAVEIEVEAPEQVTCEECDYWICAKSGYLHLIVPKSRFTLLKGEESLTTYAFNTGTARHLSCRVCGIKTFYAPRSNPDGCDVNVRRLEPQPRETVVRPFDGREREANAASLAHLSRE